MRTAEEEGVADERGGDEDPHADRREPWGGPSDIDQIEACEPKEDISQQVRELEERQPPADPWFAKGLERAAQSRAEILYLGMRRREPDARRREQGRNGQYRGSQRRTSPARAHRDRCPKGERSDDGSERAGEDPSAHVPFG